MRKLIYIAFLLIGMISFAQTTVESVSNLKSLTGLSIGDIVETQSYYEGEQIGGNKYTLVSSSTTGYTDNGGTIIFTNDSKVFKSFKKDIYTTAMFGIKSVEDGNNSDTGTDINKVIDAAINDNVSKVLINQGTYNVHGYNNSYTVSSYSPYNLHGIILKDGIELIIDRNTTIKVIPNSSDNYSAISIVGSNTKISGAGEVIGDYGYHTGSTGQWGHCVKIYNESNPISNIEIKDLKLSKGWGDCLYISYADDIIIDNIKTDYTGRNGISLTDKCKNVLISNSTFKNASKAYNSQSNTTVGAGIDIEPNISTNYSEDIFIDNCVFEDNLNVSVIMSKANNVIINKSRLLDDKTSIGNNINGVIISNNLINNLSIIGNKTDIAKNITVKNNTIGKTTLTSVNNVLFSDNIFNNSNETSRIVFINPNTDISSVNDVKNISFDGNIFDNLKNVLNVVNNIGAFNFINNKVINLSSTSSTQSFIFRSNNLIINNNYFNNSPTDYRLLTFYSVNGGSVIINNNSFIDSGEYTTIEDMSPQTTNTKTTIKNNYFFNSINSSCIAIRCENLGSGFNGIYIVYDNDAMYYTNPFRLDSSVISADNNKL